MATKTRNRVRKNVGSTTASRNGDGHRPKSPSALIPNFDRAEPGEPHCAAIAESGIRTVNDMIRFNGTMITDILRKRLPANDAQAINRNNTLSLRGAELQAKYGRQVGPDGQAELVINDSVPANRVLAAS